MTLIELQSLSYILVDVWAQVGRPKDADGIAADAIRALCYQREPIVTCYRGRDHISIAVTGLHEGDDPGECLEIYEFTILTSTPGSRVATVSKCEWRRPVTPATAPDALCNRLDELERDGETMGEREHATWLDHLDQGASENHDLRARLARVAAAGAQ